MSDFRPWPPIDKFLSPSSSNRAPNPTYGKIPFNHGASGHSPIYQPKRSPTRTQMSLLNLPTSAKEGILGQVQHPKSYARIQEIEAPKPKPQDVPDLPKQVSRFIFISKN